MYDLVDNIIAEITHAGIKRKQRSITRLFPEFDARVRQIAAKGGLRLHNTTPELWHFKIHSGTQDSVWYDAYIKFKDMSDLINTYVKDIRLWTKSKEHVDLRKLAKKIMFKADIQVKCSCLVGNTKIPLLDGRILTIDEIYKEFGSDKEFWLYASDSNGDFVPAKALCLGVTDQVKHLVKVTLDNGEEIKCTPDHLFRMRDGSYRRADELQPIDSLMPLYLMKTKPSSLYSQSYLKVKLNSKYKPNGNSIWKMVHRVVAEFLFDTERTEKILELSDSKSDWPIVHHKDFNTQNNIPENLGWLGKLEHWYLHSKNSLNSIRGYKKAWKDPEFRKRCTENNRRAGKICIEKHPELVVKFNEAGIKYMRSAEGRAQIAKIGRDPEQIKKRTQSLKNTLRVFPSKIRLNHSKRLKETWASGKIDKAKVIKRASERRLVGSKNPMSKKDNRLMVPVGQILSICFVIYRKGLPLTEFNYEEARKERRGCARFHKCFGNINTLKEVFDLALTKTLYGDYRGFWPEDKVKVLNIVRKNVEKTEERKCLVCNNIFRVYPLDEQILCSENCKIQAFAHSHNHKVAKVKHIWLNNNVPVYDLSVKDYNNFALSAGVYVHNCPAFLYYGPAFILSKPKYDGKYNGEGPENRPPRIRNPKQFGAVCKHLQNLLNVYPWYITTMATWLRDNYGKQITTIEDEFKKERGQFKAAGAELGKLKKAAEKPKPVEPKVKEPMVPEPELKKPIVPEPELEPEKPAKKTGIKKKEIVPPEEEPVDREAAKLAVKKEKEEQEEIEEPVEELEGDGTTPEDLKPKPGETEGEFRRRKDAQRKKTKESVVLYV